MKSDTYQAKKWKSEFGEDFIKRNSFAPEELDKSYKRRYGVSKTDMINEFLVDIPKDAKILEVGTNIGNQLLHLQSMGFTNLYGIEIQERAINYAKHRADNLNIIKGDVLDIPFKDNYFDLVFTNVVLIHISPANIKRAISEIVRSSKKYIFGLEYFAEEYMEIVYRNETNLLWKTNFSKLFLDANTDIKLLKEKKYPYIEDISMVDQMYLLEV